jgi:uncharacterized membrane protein
MNIFQTLLAVMIVVTIVIAVVFLVFIFGGNWEGIWKSGVALLVIGGITGGVVFKGSESQIFNSNAKPVIVAG